MTKSPDPIAAVVARRLREIRGHRGFSAQKLAERCAEVWPQSTLDRSVIANLENERRRGVSVDELLVLAYVLDVSPITLLIPEQPDELMTVGTVVSRASRVSAWISGHLLARDVPEPDRETGDRETARLMVTRSALRRKVESLERQLEEVENELERLLTERRRRIDDASEEDE